jgi:hypothetical protein
MGNIMLPIAAFLIGIVGNILIRVIPSRTIKRLIGIPAMALMMVLFLIWVTQIL